MATAKWQDRLKAAQAAAEAGRAAAVERAEWFGFREEGDYLTGRIVERFTFTAKGDQKEGVRVQVGDANDSEIFAVGLSADLLQKIGPDMNGHIVSIFFVGREATPNGEMKMYSVFDWDTSWSNVEENVLGYQTTPESD